MIQYSAIGISGEFHIRQQGFCAAVRRREARVSTEPFSLRRTTYPAATRDPMLTPNNIYDAFAYAAWSSFMFAAVTVASAAAAG